MRHIVHESESLFGLMEGRVPFQSHSASSRLAAGEVKPKAGTQRGIVLAYLRSRGSQGASDFEGIRDLRDKITSIENAYRARRQSLAEDGFIKLAEFKRINPSSGVECEVWVAKEVTDDSA